MITFPLPEWKMPPPLLLAELPLNVQLVTLVVVPVSANRPPPATAELPLTVQLASVVVPREVVRTPPPVPAEELPRM